MNEQKKIIINSYEGGSALSFDGLVSNHKEYYLSVTLSSYEITAKGGAYLFNDLTSIISFFESIERDWKGWKGSKRWESIESDLIFDCVSDKLGHYTINVEMKHVDPPKWHLNASVTFVPGELPRIIQEARDFFGEAEK